MEIKGLGELEKKLKQMQKGAERASGERSATDIFTDDFMLKYTKHPSIDRFFEASPFTIETNEDLENTDEKELDVYVNDVTKFTTWEEMLGKAAEEYLIKQMGL
ncbi:hypothetical protein BTR22_18585 [Alkalihalophilus pseudofirmus]|uniref:hypothetical protein n=1 Tax=Alkalihalophilus pseudofirmus TaxID=79885 RepID=UPI0009528435|nr:hypothetical protein BTR22_18585 [Alkalihalophilus pseudofirmus]